MFLTVLALHAAVAVLAAAVGCRLGRRVFLLTAVPPLAAVGAAVLAAPAVLGGRPVAEALTWAPSLGVDLDLRVDAFALLMLTLVSGVGVLVMLYAHGYFTTARDDLGRFASTLLAFSGAMLGLVLTDSLLGVFVFWELTSITSYLLIGFTDRVPAARAAALQALLITGAGGLALMAGLVLIGQAAGTYQMSEVLAAPPTGAAVEAGLVLCLLGAFTKSAQVPFHTWLPGAMAAPTPVSAYLHSATMVKAGVYLVARFAPAFAETSVVWRPAVVTVGLATMAVGGYRALRQHDVKLLLAYGTVSQLGFLTVLLGVGTAEATYAGCALLLAHGAFKAALFMTVGIVDHQAHTRDLRRLTGLGRRLRGVAVVGTVAVASMAGVPLLFGFVAKEAAYESMLHGDLGGTLDAVVLVGIVAGSVLTFAYSARFVRGTFWSKPTAELAPDAVDPAAVHPPNGGFVAPAAVLAVATLCLGFYPQAVDALVNGAALALDARWEGEALAAFHGLNLALGLSALTVASGAALFATRRAVERVQAAAPGSPDAAAAFEAGVAGTVSGARRLTAVVQHGSLPVYLAVISVAVVGLPSLALFGGAEAPLAPAFAANPLQAGVVAVIVAGALACVRTRRRFTAVLFLGAVGFGVAVLFVVQGAPDLALTQFLVETLALVVFVLVLRHLPPRFEVRHRGYRAWRVVVAVSVGVFVSSFALLAGAARTAPSVSGELIARALPEAEGRNVVNVILVDFRGLDTFGEITVLAVAALGVATLVQAARRDRGGDERFDPRGDPEGQPGGVAAAPTAGGRDARRDEPRVLRRREPARSGTSRHDSEAP